MDEDEEFDEVDAEELLLEEAYEESLGEMESMERTPGQEAIMENVEDGWEETVYNIVFDGFGWEDVAQLYVEALGAEEFVAVSEILDVGFMAAESYRGDGGELASGGRRGVGALRRGRRGKNGADEDGPEGRTRMGRRAVSAARMAAARRAARVAIKIITKV